jgi:hypothetical protein
VTVNATTTPDESLTLIESGEQPSVNMGITLLEDLAWQALSEHTDADESPDQERLDEIEDSAIDCLEALLMPIRPLRGQRRQAERFREMDRIALMLAEGWIAGEHYDLSRTRNDAASLMGLTPRQLRTREALLQRAFDHFGLDSEVTPAFRGRPPGRGWKPATGGRPGTRRRVAAQLGISERMLYRFLHADETVHVDIVDRVLCNAGTSTMLRDLYPDFYDSP